ncbi:MAG: fibronectin type III domain-containing protein, partial [Gemmatimonadota bacterium]
MTYWPALLAVLALAAEARAGTNAGYTVRIQDPIRIVEPQVGQTVRVVVTAQNTKSVKGIKITAVYNPLYLGEATFIQGSITPTAISLPAQPVDREDGRQQIDGGSTILGSIQQTTGGILGTFTFKVLAPVPETGTSISIIYAEVNASSSDKDVHQFDRGQFAVSLVRNFPNQVFDLDIRGRQSGADFIWHSRFAGLLDTLQIRPADSTAVAFATFTNPLRSRVTSQVLAARDSLIARNIDIRSLDDVRLREAVSQALGIDIYQLPTGFVGELRQIDEALRSRTHVVPVGGLAPATWYEFRLFSTSKEGRSPLLTGRFSTRNKPDLRPLFVNNLDLQMTPTSVAAAYGLNRPASTSYVLTRVADGATAAEGTLNEDGATVGRIVVENLQPGTAYELAITVTVIGKDDLIAAGLSPGEATRIVRRTFHTRELARPVRLLRPPAKIVSVDRAQIVFAANQPVNAIVDYGIVADPSRKITQTSAVSDGELYQWQSQSVAALPLHDMSLANLDPATRYRYKITLVNAEGDTFTTDPRGDEQWSVDLGFTTTALADTMPPAVIRGPMVHIRDVLAVVRFATDVPTAATIFIGTEGGTYNTEDEYEFSDLAPSGERRFANRHSIVVQGLEPGARYRYRLEVEAANGKTTTMEPAAPGSGKRAGILQPPGGAGSFTTSNDPDTQFPVILSGPTVTSKTHDTAVIEWTTDEPSDSDVRFGVSTMGSQETSGSSVTAHKMTLSNLTAGSTYSFLVASTDASGNGATESATAIFTTNPDFDLTAPAISVAPAVIYKNDEAATIQWTTDEVATGEVSFGTTESLGFIRTLPTTDRVHEITLTNLEPSTTYYYQTASSDLSNNGPTQSSVLQFTTDALADAAAPVISGVDAAASDSSAIVTWLTDELADSYVDFGTVQGLLDLIVGDVEDAKSHEITLTNLTPGTTYYYTVGSIDRANNGAVSAVGQFTTLTSRDGTPPAAPSGL